MSDFEIQVQELHMALVAQAMAGYNAAATETCKKLQELYEKAGLTELLYGVRFAELGFQLKAINDEIDEQS